MQCIDPKTIRPIETGPTQVEFVTKPHEGFLVTEHPKAGYMEHLVANIAVERHAAALRKAGVQDVILGEEIPSMPGLRGDRYVIKLNGCNGSQMNKVLDAIAADIQAALPQSDVTFEQRSGGQFKAYIEPQARLDKSGFQK